MKFCKIFLHTFQCVRISLRLRQSLGAGGTEVIREYEQLEDTVMMGTLLTNEETCGVLHNYVGPLPISFSTEGLCFEWEFLTASLAS